MSDSQFALHAQQTGHPDIIIGALQEAAERIAAERDQAAAALARVLAACDAIDRERLARVGERPRVDAIESAMRTMQYVTVGRVRAAIKGPTQ